jgi:hypothetical protein
MVLSPRCVGACYARPSVGAVESDHFRLRRQPGTAWDYGYALLGKADYRYRSGVGQRMGHLLGFFFLQGAVSDALHGAAITHDR